MPKSVKVAISLPVESLRAIDEMSRARNKSRSEFIREAALWLVEDCKKRDRDERYAEAYRQFPESQGDAGSRAWHDVGLRALGEEPWE